MNTASTVIPGKNIAGVQFRRAGKLYDFDLGTHPARVGDFVVVETERGQAVAKVISMRFLHPQDSPKDQEIRVITRLASERDIASSVGKISPGFAEDVAKTKVREARLNMKIIGSDVQFGGNKITIYFTAPARVDFRDLVKNLATSLRSRVELKQVGARDETKIMGGVGVCGREYCCSSFLREFVPVSIKMAKNQNLALNPTKISGGCGRLLCCLTYENDLYSELRRKMPPRGTKVRTQDGEQGVIIKGDLLNQTCTVELGQNHSVVLPISKLEIIESGPAQNRDDDGAGTTPEWGDDIDINQLLEE